MHKEFAKAYEALVPKDRLVVDAMLIALSQKDKELHRMTEQMKDVLDELGGPGE